MWYSNLAVSCSTFLLEFQVQRFFRSLWKWSVHSSTSISRIIGPARLTCKYFVCITVKSKNLVYHIDSWETDGRNSHRFTWKIVQQTSFCSSAVDILYSCPCCVRFFFLHKSRYFNFLYFSFTYINIVRDNVSSTFRWRLRVSFMLATIFVFDFFSIFVDALVNV